jgi:salicylate hydroxylase
MARARAHAPLTVAVVGGGIGGLTAAIALVRKGIEVLVLERMPTLTTVGAQLSIGPNAIRLLGALGLLDRLREVGVRPEAVQQVRWDDGSLLLQAPFGAAGEEHFGAPLLDFVRTDLQHVLLDALPEGILRLDVPVTALEQDEASVSVVLADESRVPADAVVAADGIRSPMRQQLAGRDAPVFSGTVVYRGLLRREDVTDLHPDGISRYWLGPYRHGVSYWVAGGRLLGLAAAVQRAEWSRESWTDPGDRQELLGYFEGWEPSLRERMRRCRTLLRSAVFVRDPLDHWSFGRVTLLGDAAHAMEPFNAQGAAQAIEDAFVLGECLEDIGPEEVPAALVRYEQARMARARELQDSSHVAATEYYLPDGDAQRARDARYATLLETQPWGLRERFWAHDVRDALVAGRAAHLG